MEQSNSSSSGSSSSSSSDISRSSDSSSSSSSSSGSGITLLSSTFPTDTLVHVCSFLPLPALSSLDRAATSHSQSARRHLLAAYSLLPLCVDFSTAITNARANGSGSGSASTSSCDFEQTEALIDFISSRFRSLRAAMFPFALRSVSLRFLKVFAQLERLHVKNMFLDLHDLVQLGEFCPRVRELCVERPYTDVGDGQAVMSEIGCFSALMSLTLRGCDDLDELSLAAIGEGCGCLETLTIEGCELISGSCIVLLCQRCPCLTYLDLTRSAIFMTDSEVIAISDALADLQCLLLEGHVQVTTCAVQHILFRASPLKKLSLSHCTSVSFSTCSFSFDRASRGLAALEYLNLSCIDQLSDTHMQRLGLLCEKLEELRLDNCPMLTGESVMTLEKGFRNLQRVSLGSELSSEKVVSSFASTLRCLHEQIQGKFIVLFENPKRDLFDDDLDAHQEIDWQEGSCDENDYAAFNDYDVDADDYDTTGYLDGDY